MNIFPPRQARPRALTTVLAALAFLGTVAAASQPALACPEKSVRIQTTPLDEIAFWFAYQGVQLQFKSDQELLKLFQKRYSTLVLSQLEKTLPPGTDYKRVSITVWISKEGKVTKTHCYSHGGTFVQGTEYFRPGVNAIMSVPVEGLHGWPHPKNDEMVYTVLTTAKNVALPALPHWWRWRTVAIQVELDAIADKLAARTATPERMAVR